MLKYNMMGTYIQAVKYPASRACVDAQKTVMGLQKPWPVLKPSARTPQRSKLDPPHDEPRY